MIHHKSTINTYPKDSMNNNICKICGNYEEDSQPSQENKNDLYLAEIFTDMYRSLTSEERIFHFKRAIENGSGIVPIQNITEFQIGLAYHLQKTNKYENEQVNNQWTNLIRILISKAIKENKSEVKKWFFSEELLRRRQILYKSDRIHKNEIVSLSEMENYPFKDKEELFLGANEVAPHEKKIRALMSAYRDSYELTLLPNFIMNLINIIESKEMKSNPFSGKKFKYNRNLSCTSES